MTIETLQLPYVAIDRRREPPTLTSARLVMRPLLAGDTAAIAARAGDPAVAYQLDRMPAPFPLALAARWIARRALRWREGRGITLAITRAGEHDVIGTVSLKISLAHRHAELGYWVAASAWGEGIATEASAALIDWGFATLRLRRIHARVLADNPASRRVVDKLGFTVEGVRPGHYRRSGAYLDVIELGIARADWPVTVAPPARPPTPRPSRRPRRPRRS